MKDHKEYEVVVGVDGSAASTAAVCWAAHDAVIRGLRLTLIHVVNPTASPWTQAPLLNDFTEWQQNEGRRVLAHALKIARDTTDGASSTAIESELVVSAAAPALIAVSKHAKLVVVGTTGHGAMARTILGSVSSGLVRHAHCPVAVITERSPEMLGAAEGPVLVGIDGSPSSKVATAIAFDEASRRGADVIALHAWSDKEVFELPGVDWSAVEAEEERILAEALAGWQERYPDVRVRRVIVCERPAHALIDRSESAQLVVVGSHGRGRLTGALLGSVSNAVVQALLVPTIVAHSPSA